MGIASVAAPVNISLRITLAGVKIMIIIRLSFFTVCFALLGCKADISVQEEAVDPVVQEIALAFVERPLLINEEEPYRTSLTDPAAF